MGEKLDQDLDLCFYIVNHYVNLSKLIAVVTDDKLFIILKAYLSLMLH